jgi:CDP-diglyceride synthetase
MMTMTTIIIIIIIVMSSLCVYVAGRLFGRTPRIPWIHVQLHLQPPI